MPAGRREETVSMRLALSRGVYERLRTIAFERRTTMSSIIHEGLRRELTRLDAGGDVTTTPLRGRRGKTHRERN
jgi:hypothetical protein